MLGYCGINCDNCPAYQGTVTGDVSLLEKAAHTFWDGAYSAQDWVCLGCLPAGQPIIAHACGRCKIRLCAAARQVANCACCPEFEGCPKLQEFLKGQGEGQTAKMARLRTRFLDRQRGA